LEAAIHEIEEILGKDQPFQRWSAIKYFERDPQLWEKQTITTKQEKEIEQLIRLTERLFDEDSETIVINERYEWLTQLT
ncbi:ferrous iron transport protein B, partial [Bacillus cereus]|nr:ferrous iron transport protein B [Bacillus cereus]